MPKTFSLEEVAEMVLPELKSGRRWLAERLNRGEIRGYKIGRTWRMTAEHVADLIERRSNTIREPEPAPPTATTPVIAVPPSLIAGLSERSRRRLRHNP